MDSKPNLYIRNKAGFSIFSGVVWTSPELDSPMDKQWKYNPCSTRWSLTITLQFVFDLMVDELTRAAPSSTHHAR